MKVVDPLGVADELFKDKGKDAVRKLVEAMKKMERIQLRGGRLAMVPRSLKLLSPGKYSIWEYKVGSLRFYFYLDRPSSTFFLLSYSTKDRQREAIKLVIKKLEELKDRLFTD